MRHAIVICLLLFFLVGCKRGFRLQKNRAQIEDMLASKYLQFRVKVNYEDPYQKTSFKVTFRIKQNKHIWFSITSTLGIEAARGMITKEGIHLMNHITKTYYHYDYPALTRTIYLTLNYELIQAILLGLLPFGSSKNYKLLKCKSKYLMLRKKMKDLVIETCIDKHTQQMKEISLLGIHTFSRFVVRYEHTKKKALFSTAQAYLCGKEGRSIFEAIACIKNIKVACSETALRFPFTVPKNYEKK